ncbi:MAG TPA: energy transducer TonB [Kofleriaceae bacterium]|nr:energy transducer TonB [Kofleriaceae bacterium]
MAAPPPRRIARGWEALAAAALVNAGLVVVLDHVHLDLRPRATAAPAAPGPSSPTPAPAPEIAPGLADVALIDVTPPALPLAAILGTGDVMADGTGANRPRSADLPGARAADRGGGAEGGTASWTERRDRPDDAALRSRIWTGPDAYRAPREDGDRRATSPEAITRRPDRSYGDRAPRPRAAAGAATASTGDADGTGRADGATRPSHEAAFVDRGERAVDVTRRGPAADERAVAGASNQRAPDPYDLTPPRAGGRHDGEGVRGPDAPGQLADGWGRGTAASRAGAGDTAGPTFATRQDPYFVELFRRLDRTITYPRELALAMTSGRVVAIVTLRADGALADITVHASSGYRQFDDQVTGALRAVGRLPPVPATLLDGRATLRVMIPYTFRSPMIR